MNIFRVAQLVERHPRLIPVATFFTLTAFNPPLSAELVVVDQMGGLDSPAQVAVSNSGDIYVTDHDRGQVVVFDHTGKRLTALADRISPLGLALLEVAPPVSEPVQSELSTAQCKALVKKYKKIMSRLLARSDRTQATLAKLKARGASQKKLNRLQKRISKYGDKIATGAGLVSQYQDCSVEPITRPSLPVVYVGNEEDGSVQIINNGSVTVLGRGAGEFEKPNGIAVTAGQTVYVVDSNVHQVRVYGSQGNLQGSFGGEGAGDGQLKFPVDIAINEDLGEVYVTDFWNERIAVFDLSGGFVRNMTAPENDAGDPAFMRPSGLGIDPAGNLYVTDTALSAVVIMDNAGALIDIIGYRDGKYWTGELSLATDVVADGNRVYVISNQEGAVKVFAEVTP